LKGPGLIAAILLIFIFVVAVAMWSLDLIIQQRTFAFLLSAELVAFAMLVYLYYVEDPNEISRRWLSSGALGLAVLVVLSAVVLPNVASSSAPTPNVSVILYEGEISSTLYGFGYSSNTLTSPGPTLTFKVNDVVNVTVIDIGQFPHNWAIVTNNQSSSAPVVFNAQFASPTNPLQHGQSGSVVFAVTQAGNFYYICQVPGHLDVGMWGAVVVNA
jgi:plastocyanin